MVFRLHLKKNYPAIETHWGRVIHICVSKLTIIGSDNGLSPGRRETIIWFNVEIFNWTIRNKCSQIVVEIYTFLFQKMYLKMSSAKSGPFCLSLKVFMDVTNCKSTGFALKSTSPCMAWWLHNGRRIEIRHDHAKHVQELLDYVRFSYLLKYHALCSLNP